MRNDPISPIVLLSTQEIGRLPGPRSAERCVRLSRRPVGRPRTRKNRCCWPPEGCSGPSSPIHAKAKEKEKAASLAAARKLVDEAEGIETVTLDPAAHAAAAARHPTKTNRTPAPGAAEGWWWKPARHTAHWPHAASTYLVRRHGMAQCIMQAAINHACAHIAMQGAAMHGRALQAANSRGVVGAAWQQSTLALR